MTQPPLPGTINDLINQRRNPKCHVENEARKVGRGSMVESCFSDLHVILFLPCVSVYSRPNCWWIELAALLGLFLLSSTSFVTAFSLKVLTLSSLLLFASSLALKFLLSALALKITHYFCSPLSSFKTLLWHDHLTFSGLCTTLDAGLPHRHLSQSCPCTGGRWEESNS